MSVEYKSFDKLPNEINENNYSSQVENSDQQDLDLLLVNAPHERYNEMLERLGLDSKVEIISAHVSSHCYINDNEVTDEIDEIKILYKKSIMRKKYSNMVLKGDYWRREERIYNLIIDVLNDENRSSREDNHYFLYEHGFSTDKEEVLQQESLQSDFKLRIEFVIVEHCKKHLKGIKNLDFYNRALGNLGVAHYDKNENNFCEETNSIEEELITQGRNTMNWFIDNTYDLYDRIHNLSLLKYEGEENRGKILFAPSSYSRDFIRFKKHIPLRDRKSLRAIRKLLEVSNKNVALFCDSEVIFGVGTIDAENKFGNSSNMSIQFKGHGSWELRDWHNNIIMNVNYGIPILPKKVIDEEAFLELCNKIFGSANVFCYYDKLWDFVDTAKQQKHGTMIVISDQAESEANRLSKNSFAIVPKEISDLNLIYNLTSIDGAVMLDHRGKCYSIGCILDGLSEENIADNSRGARYNSALRYINYCISRKIKVLVVIVSEDGMINIETEETYNRLKNSIETQLKSN